MNLKLLLPLIAISCSYNRMTMKTITKNNMTVSWEIRSDTLYVEAFAPTEGWVAIGLNTDDQLQGTNLIMGCVIKGEVFIEDHYIRRPGDHLPIISLGGKDALQHRTGKEDALGTTIRFQLPLKAVDKFHLHLEACKAYYLLMAYSQEDDFNHHSMMRTSVKIIL